MKSVIKAWLPFDESFEVSWHFPNNNDQKHIEQILMIICCHIFNIRTNQFTIFLSRKTYFQFQCIIRTSHLFSLVIVGLANYYNNITKRKKFKKKIFLFGWRLFWIQTRFLFSTFLINSILNKSYSKIISSVSREKGMLSNVDSWRIQYLSFFSFS